MRLPHAFSATGIILRRINIGESDRVLTVLTKQYGKIRVIAKGTRKITSRRAPYLDLFNEVQLSLHKAKTWDIVTEVSGIHMRRDTYVTLTHMKAAYLVAESIDKLLPDSESQPALYLYVSTFFTRLETCAEEHVGKEVLTFLNGLLVMLGYMSYEHVSDTISASIGRIETITERKIRSTKFFSMINMVSP